MWAVGPNGNFVAPTVGPVEVGLDGPSVAWTHLEVEADQRLDEVGIGYLRRMGPVLDEPLELVEPLEPFELGELQKVLGRDERMALGSPVYEQTVWEILSEEQGVPVVLGSLHGVQDGPEALGLLRSVVGGPVEMGQQHAVLVELGSLQGAQAVQGLELDAAIVELAEVEQGVAIVELVEVEQVVAVVELAEVERVCSRKFFFWAQHCKSACTHTSRGKFKTNIRYAILKVEYKVWKDGPGKTTK